MPQFADKAEFEINFMPFSLNPDLPGGAGVDKQKSRAKAMQRMGISDEDDAKRRQDTIDTWAQDGLKLSYGGRTGSSFDAHRLVRLARRQGKEDLLVDELYSNYHEQEKCLSERSVLLAAAEKVGLVGAAEFLDSDQDVAELKLSYRKYQEWTNTVPFFIINDTYTECGAPELPFLENLFSWLIDGGSFSPGGALAGTPAIPPEERRVFPADGKVYSFKDWMEKYGRHYTITQLAQVWNTQLPLASNL